MSCCLRREGLQRCPLCKEQAQTDAMAPLPCIDAPALLPPGNHIRVRVCEVYS